MCDATSHVPTADPAKRRSRRALFAYYFFSMGGLGSLFPFVPIFFAQRGLTPQEISLVLMAIPLANLVVPAVWGFAADYIRAPVLLLRIIALGSSLSILLLHGAYGVGATFLAFAGFWLFRAALGPLADATVHLDAQARPHYHTIRAWGSAGFAACVWLTGLLRRQMSLSLIIWLTSALHMLAALVTRALRSRGALVLSPRSEWRGLRQLLARPTILALLIAHVFHFAGQASYDAYFSLFLTQKGHSLTFVGTAWAIGVAVEVFLMLMFRRWFGHLTSVSILMACAVLGSLRWYLIGQLDGWALLVFAQPLHAATFGIWYLSMVRATQERAPDAYRGSFQGVSQASVGGGMFIGYLGGGMVLARAGGTTLFRAAALSSLVAATIYGWTRRQIRRFNAPR